MQHRMKCHLPLDDAGDALYVHALYGAEGHPELKASGAVDMPALLNAICAYYPEYTALHNQEARKYAGGSDLINQTPGVGTDFIGF